MLFGGGIRESRWATLSGLDEDDWLSDAFSAAAALLTIAALRIDGTLEWCPLASVEELVNVRRTKGNIESPLSCNLSEVGGVECGISAEQSVMLTGLRSVYVVVRCRQDGLPCAPDVYYSA